MHIDVITASYGYTDNLLITSISYFYGGISDVPLNFYFKNIFIVSSSASKSISSILRLTAIDSNAAEDNKTKYRLECLFFIFQCNKIFRL